MLKSRVSAFCMTATLAITAASPLLASPTGADTFKAKCVVCHGSDGGGNTPLGQRMKIRDLRSADVQKQSNEALTAIVTNGQKAMPAFGKSLGGEKIEAVVAFIRDIAAK